MSKYSENFQGKVLDYGYLKRDNDYVFSIGHGEDRIVLGTVGKDHRGTWVAVSSFENKYGVLYGWSSRANATDYLLQVFRQTHSVLYESESYEDTTIISNQATCLVCQDSIWSSHRHDYVTCSCGNLSVDGGNSYIRRFGSIGKIKEQSISIPTKVLKVILEEVEPAFNTGRNALGVTYAVIRGIRNAGYRLEKGT